MIRLGNRLCAGLICWFAALSPGAAQPGPAVLTNAAQVRALTPEAAARSLPVKLKGVVISEANPRERTLFLADDTAGIYAVAEANLFSSYRRGDLLELEGVSDPGGFAPIIRVTRSRRVGRGDIPSPIKVTYPQLITGALDGQWIELTGVVRRCIEPQQESTIWRILVAADGGVVSVRGSMRRDAAIQPDAEVRVRAICLYQFTQKRQVLTPILSVPSGVQVEVVTPPPPNPFELPVRSADSLLQFSPTQPSGHRVHVRGVVTHAETGSLVWIRDQSSGLRIQAAQNESLEAGDVIDILGFPAYGRHSPMLEDAIFRKTGDSQSPAPILLANITAAFDHEDNLVETEALLTEIQRVHQGLEFTFEAESAVFKGFLRLSTGERPDPSWLAGSVVQVAGICQLIHDEVRPLMGVWQPQSFQLLLRNVGDLKVTQAPPWWPRHITHVLVAASLALLLGISIVTVVSRRRLKDQAVRRAMAEAQFAAILNERNRVAREIHDTLAQGLVATSVQLRLAKKTATNGSDELTHHLDSAQQLISESLEEARNSIWNMRSQVLESGDLSAALNVILKHMAEGSSAETRCEVSGRMRRLPPVVENNILRIGQEAITNAARHSGASHITVQLDFGERALTLKVRDDGSGFDPAQPPPSQGGFGLVGMRERAAELKAKLDINSAPGKGTEVSLTLPLSS